VFINYAAFVPVVRSDKGTLSYTLDGIYGLWNHHRFISLVMGEIPRLLDDDQGYGPNGKDFIVHVEIPVIVMSAYERLHPDLGQFLELRE